MVVFQFTVSACFIMASIMVFKQIKFLQNQNTGFDKENVVVVNATDVDAEKIFPLFKQAILKDPAIAGIAGSELGLGEGTGWSRGGFL